MVRLLFGLMMAGRTNQLWQRKSADENDRPTDQKTDNPNLTVLSQQQQKTKRRQQDDAENSSHGATPGCHWPKFFPAIFRVLPGIHTRFAEQFELSKPGQKTSGMEQTRNPAVHCTRLVRL